MLASIMALLLAGCTSAEPLPDYGPAPSFTLTDQSGTSLSLHGSQGKVRLVDFIYTHCPDICPLSSTHMSQVQKDLTASGLSGKDFQLISISVDPERDSPEVLREYAKRYDADFTIWHFLTGPAAEVERIMVNGFKVHVEQITSHGGEQPHEQGHQQSSYMVNHTGPLCPG